MAQDSRTQLFFIFCVLFGVGCVYCQGTKKESVETGKSYTFKPNINSTITLISWKFTKKPGDVINLVDWEPRTGIYWYSHQDRANLTTENGELTINKLTKEDSGLYEVELEVDGVLKSFKYELTVMDCVYCQETKKETVETGKSYTFKPNVNSTITIIVWMFAKKPGDVIRLVDWDPRTGIFWYSDQDRANLTTENGELTINKMTKEDSGLYEVELEVDGVLKSFKYELTVMGCVYCQGTKKENVETGKSYTFKPNINSTITLIAWKFTKKPGDVINLVDWDPRTGIYWYSHQDRANLTTENGELTINKLTKGDSGLYEVELEVDGVLKSFKYELTVMDGVSKPQVTCDFKDNTIDLVCSVDPQVNAEFTWRRRNGIPKEGKSRDYDHFCTAKHGVSTKDTQWKPTDYDKDGRVSEDVILTQGERISIPEEQSSNSVYFCTAKNEVSTKTTEFKLEDCYKDPLNNQ